MKGWKRKNSSRNEVKKTIEAWKKLLIIKKSQSCCQRSNELQMNQKTTLEQLKAALKKYTNAIF